MSQGSRMTEFDCQKGHDFLFATTIKTSIRPLFSVTAALSSGVERLVCKTEYPASFTAKEKNA
jgi:hypothetical protein